MLREIEESAIERDIIEERDVAMEPVRQTMKEDLVGYFTFMTALNTLRRAVMHR